MAGYVCMPCVYGFVFSPLQNSISRHFEHEADIFGLQKTDDGESAAGAFEKLASANLSNPNPSAIIKFWLYDHPPLSERVTFARSWKFTVGTVSIAPPSPDSLLLFPGEKHLRNIRQLTFGGENAEAYFSMDGQKLVLQSTRDGYPCDRIYTMNIDGSGMRLISTGQGVTTCSFWAPDGKRIIYCSTHLVDDSCPPKPSHGQGYVWPLYKGYDVFSCKPDGADLKRLTETAGYDAEAVYSNDGSKILFTSVRDGDLELYTMNGSRVSARIAGIESTAKITSVVSITISTTNSGVAESLPARRTKNLPPWYSAVTGIRRRKRRTIGLFSGSIFFSFSCHSLMPDTMSTAPNT